VEGIADWAPDVLRKAAKSFKTEVRFKPPYHSGVHANNSYQTSIVKLQTLTLAAKLTLLAPVNRTLTLLARYILALARYDEDWDVRDRGRMLGSLLVGAVAGVVSGNDDDGIGEYEEQGARPGGVVLRREQVMRVLFDGKTGTIQEEVLAGEFKKITTGTPCNYESFFLLCTSPSSYPSRFPSARDTFPRNSGRQFVST